MLIKILLEIENEILLDYTGEFEMFGGLKVGDHRTHIRFRNMDDFESYINAIEEGYDAEDAIFIGYIYKLKTLQFNLFNRSLDLNMELVVILNMKLLYIGVRIVLFRQKDIVSLIVFFS